MVSLLERIITTINKLCIKSKEYELIKENFLQILGYKFY